MLRQPMLVHIAKYQSGDLDGGLEMLQKALAIREKVFGMEHPSTAASHDKISLLVKARIDMEHSS